MVSYDEALERVRKECYKLQVRLDDFCKTHGKRGHVKKITQAQFKRALDQAIPKARITDDEIAAILSVHGTTDYGRDEIRYDTFCKEVNLAFTMPNMESNPKADFTATYQGGSYRVGEIGDEMDELDQIQLDGVLNKIKGWASSQGVILKDSFKDFDKCNDGTVTKEQFKRSMNTLFKELSETEIALVAKKYVAHFNEGIELNYDVSYKRLHEDVVPEGPPGTGAMKPESVVRKPVRSMAAADPVDVVESKCLRIVSENRVRTAEPFVDFDKFHTGNVTYSQFVAGLSKMFGARLSQVEMNQLATKYAANGGKVNWKSFVSLMESTSVTSGLESNPGATMPSRVAATVQAGRRAINPSSNISAYDRGMSTLSREVATQRIDMFPLFKDKDPRREEHVTFTQFDQVLATLKLFEKLSAVEWAAIKQVYTANDNGKHNARLFINYADFCDAIDPPKARTGYLGRTGALLTTSAAAPSARSAHAIVVGIAKFCKSQRIRIKEDMEDYDKLRSGKITVDQFKRGLDKAKVLPRLQAEVDALVEEYTHMDGSGLVAWTRFERAVESANTVFGLEATPTVDVSATIAIFDRGDEQSNNTIYGSDRADEQSNNMSDALVGIIERMAFLAKSVEINFKDFDLNNNGYLPKSTFKRAITSMNLTEIGDAQIGVLENFFRAGRMQTAGQAADRFDVDYHALKYAMHNTIRSGGEIKNSAAYRKMVRCETSELGSSVVRKPVRVGKTVDLDALLADIREFCERNGVRLDEFFKEYDKHSKGTVAKAKFISTLAQLKMPDLEDCEIDALVNSYPADGLYASDQCNWKKFCRAVEPNPNLEKDPDASVARFGQSIFRRTSFLAGSKDRSIAAIKNQCETSRIHLKPYFQNYDKANCRKIKKTNFFAVLDNTKIKEKSGCTEADLENLAIAYQCIKRGAKVDEIDYYKFCKDVDPSTEVC